MRIAVERRGRPPMPDRTRDARGRSRGESPTEIVATARAQRIKAAVDPADALNALNGTTLCLPLGQLTGYLLPLQLATTYNMIR